MAEGCAKQKHTVSLTGSTAVSGAVETKTHHISRLRVIEDLVVSWLKIEHDTWVCIKVWKTLFRYPPTK